ncbi:MAG TPA: CehA/McbA family metallohydrolase [Tepidiformaceae bacterium]|nr:CehA/McbA family metallohydrolase [Tepidiformaceae bacterium]
MLIDLHCHTQPLSACSALTIDALIEAAVSRGIEGICLTEHDRAWDGNDLERIARRSPIPIFSAVELTTDMGHILAFGLPGPDAFSPLAADVFSAAEASGALLFLAHPARDGLLRVSHETVEYFVSVETENGSDSRLQNMAAAGLAKGFRLPGIGGSDAHSRDEVGRAATRFEARINTDRELLEALRSGRYEAVSLA